MTARAAGFSVTNSFVHGVKEVNSEGRKAVLRTDPGAFAPSERREEL